MRHLNKVVFINSAHIPLAELKLDGNVHFIGTQGVGKSTLLRAILFFYNADKQRLGIPKEKESFDSYYFPYANSYIVYEVIRENSAYCVVAAKSQGRVFFRFVDAPYDRNWFLNEHNEVSADWGRIREQIGKGCFVSAQVTSYEMYRDIIFGNNRRQDMLVYRKFAIVESAKYQNIPRTIQNVFLNTKLDADFIKDTIIRSMSDEETAIDLDFYRGQIKEFEQEYNDVMLWFDKNKNGEIPVRKNADRVINSYRDLLYTKKQIGDGRAELNYAEHRALEKMPLVKEDITKSEFEQKKQQISIDDLGQKYEKERDDFVKQLAVISGFLKQVREKQQYYERINIDDIIERVRREDILNDETEQLKEMKARLTNAFDDIITKYKPMFDQLESDKLSFENKQQNKIIEKRSETADKKDSLRDDLREQEEQLRALFEEKLQILNDRITGIREEQAVEKQKLDKVSYEEPFKKQKGDCNAEIELLDRKEHELKLNIEKQKMEATRLRGECEQKRKEQEWESLSNSDRTRKEGEEIKQKLEVLDGLIERRKGSFCEWLEENKPGWEDTIGKVAVEDSVLYSQELNPSFDKDSDSFFGIALNLSSIERNIRTPEELKRERDGLQNKSQELSKELNRLSVELAGIVSDLEKKYSKQIRDINHEQYQMEAELAQIPQKIKNQKAELNTWQTKEDEWKRIQREAIGARREELAHQLRGAEEDKSKCNAERDKKLKACRKSNEDRVKELLKELQAFIDEVNAEIKQKRQQCELTKEEFTDAQHRELSGKGADTQAISKCDAQIEAKSKELAYIRENRSKVSDYEKDKREFFDKEISQKDLEKELKIKLDNLKHQFEQKKHKLVLKLNEINSTLNEHKEELKKLETGLSDLLRFRQDSTFSPPGSDEIRKKTSHKSCSEIVDELISLIISTNKKTDEFKRAVNQFKGNFSSKNTFHFRMELNDDTDYNDFAANLCEFVDNDKISEYQKRISERYIDIIRRISKEVGDLTRNESEVNKTIKDINEDFVKRNFAGVIKEIALRPQQSSDKLMQLLLEVKRFSDENQYNMGEVDLFSQASREEVNATAVRYLLSFMKYLLDDPARKQLSLSDTFQLQFRIKENDNDTDWVEKIANVGSEGTDVLVKAMVNIMLINVFKEKASRKFGEFKIHCMMDEIGKLHPNNVKGILEFANCRNILLINSSPTTFNAADYRYTYLLSKDDKSNTQVIPLLTINKK